ncbi:MAG TPA: S8 family serine peptidase, partial [Steroidobacteraceae bacterium]|nr:S8 family serine peptidase [Steroidobacteraceae bacterium]
MARMFLLLAALFSISIALPASAPLIGRPAPEHAQRYLVQAVSVSVARRSVMHVGATVEQNLPIVNGVAARLSASQADRLRATDGIRLFADRAIRTSQSLLSTLLGTTEDVVSTTLVTANTVPLITGVTGSVVGLTSGSSVPQDGTGENTPTLLYQTNYPMLVGADTLQQAGITGTGVTIAMLDSGLWQALSQNYGGRILGTIDVTNGGSGPVTGDPYGHGTHITSIAAGGAVNLSGSYLGIAPGAKLVIVRAFNGQ